ncbi:hypothetical protein BC941DRAFT_427268 [Chlamydoabsidia padenii]|nr:hypothetical protein BC941DRAFT_427268 [Chlamydoabsidia padenii]
MEQESHQKENFIDSPPRPISLRNDYEYLVYQPDHYAGLDIPVTVVMKAHEGFVWNQELFVGEHRLGKQYKSVSRQVNEAKIQQACHRHSGNNRVMNLNLSSSDKDIFP